MESKHTKTKLTEAQIMAGAHAAKLIFGKRTTNRQKHSAVSSRETEKQHGMILNRGQKDM